MRVALFLGLMFKAKGFISSGLGLKGYRLSGLQGLGFKASC